MSMNEDLRARVTSALERDYAFKSRGGKYLLGECPDCHKKEAYTHADSPWIVYCNRKNECGAEIHIKDLYPDFFASWSDRFPSTPENHNAAADAYLTEARGFDIAPLKGMYTQESIGRKGNNNTEIHSATVRFTHPSGWWWERIIDRPERFGKQKANFRGEFGGTWWTQHSLDALVAASEIWVVEGIFDALSLDQHGLTACAIMTSGQFPRKALEELKAKGGAMPTLVWALDNDKAGTGAIPKHIEKAAAMGYKNAAAQIPRRFYGRDWNDLHLNKTLDSLLDECRYEGKLLLAKNPREKAKLIAARHPRWNDFYFEFGQETYWHEASKDPDKYPEPSVFPIANCVATPLYYQSDRVTGESWYYFSVTGKNGTHKDTFTGAQLASGSEFKKRLLSVSPGALFEGTTGQLNMIIRGSLKRIKTVETIDFIGYSKAHEAYIFDKQAVKAGKLYELNKQDYFDLPKLQIKSLASSPEIRMNTELGKFAEHEMLKNIWEAYGVKGIVVLAFWLGSFFAEQIRAKDQTYPFLELVGDPGTGKSTLLEYLWRASGREGYEGFDPSKSTNAGRFRNFAKIANMPVVMIEGDRTEGNRVSFDFNALKDAYNGRAIMTRGIKNNANDTYEPPFKGAIIISQNAVVNTDEAVMQRIVQVLLKREDCDYNTMMAAKRLQDTPMEKVSGFMFRALSHEQKIMQAYTEHNAKYKELLLSFDTIKTNRLAETHAQISALVHALAHVLPLSTEQINQTIQHIGEMAEQRQKDIGADLPIIQQFWDIYDVLNGADSAPRLNHSASTERIAINLVHFEQVCKRNNVNPPDMVQLKRVLRSSRRHKYIENTSVSSVIARYSKHKDDEGMSASQKCWIFEN